MDNPMGDSAASHEGVEVPPFGCDEAMEYLEPDAKDDEKLNMTRGQLRVLANELLNLAMSRLEGQLHRRIDQAEARLQIDNEQRWNKVREQVAELLVNQMEVTP